MGEIAKEKLNGFDTEVLKQVMGQVSKDPSVGKVKFQVTTTWKGTTKSETVVRGYEIGGQKVKRIHTFVIAGRRSFWVKTRPPILKNTSWER